MTLRRAGFVAAVIACGPVAAPDPPAPRALATVLWDAHTHLSLTGPEALERLVAAGVSITPTLVYFRASAVRAESAALRQAREEALGELIALMGRLHRAGVPIIAGSDVAGVESRLEPGASLLEELALLEQAGIPTDTVRATTDRVLSRWFAAR